MTGRTLINREAITVLRTEALKAKQEAATIQVQDVPNTIRWLANRVIWLCDRELKREAG